MNIQPLEKEFEGTGDVKGFKFRQIEEREEGFIYRIDDDHYEVFKREITAKCIDFQKKIFSETDFKVKYPKTNDFGKWAHTTKSLEKAYEILSGFRKNE